MLEDPYPAVRRIAWRSARALSGSLALDWNGYVPTAGRQARRGFVERLRALAFVLVPDPSAVSRLRAQAADVAIEIGE